MTRVVLIACDVLQRVEFRHQHRVIGAARNGAAPHGHGADALDLPIQCGQTGQEFLGLCLGMQLAIVEYARHVAGLEDAHSIELNPQTPYPVIALLPDQNGVEDIGGTLRLGAYPCILDKTTKAYELYGSEEIHERHRHRYEVNNDFRRILVDKGMTLSGLSPDGRIVEMIELKDHPFFIGTQAHPELKSRPNRPHPLFRGFVEAALHRHEVNEAENASKEQ